MAVAKPSEAVTLRAPKDVLARINDLAQQSGRDFESVAVELLDEAVRMRRVPGIVFADEGNRRAARVGGTGLEVWEIIRTYRE